MRADEVQLAPANVDHGGTSHLTACTGGRRDRDGSDDPRRDSLDAPVHRRVIDERPWMRRRQSDSLCEIDRGSAADRDDSVAAAGAERLRRFQHGKLGRIRRGAIEPCHPTWLARFGDDAVRNAGGPNAGVRNHQRTRDRELPEHLGQQRGRAEAERRRREVADRREALHRHAPPAVRSAARPEASTPPRPQRSSGTSWKYTSIWSGRRP